MGDLSALDLLECDGTEMNDKKFHCTVVRKKGFWDARRAVVLQQWRNSKPARILHLRPPALSTKFEFMCCSHYRAVYGVIASRYPYHHTGGTPALRRPCPATTNGNELAHCNVNCDGVNLTFLGNIMTFIFDDQVAHWQNIDVHVPLGIGTRDRDRATLVYLSSLDEGKIRPTKEYVPRPLR
ncbi:hypothetical protein BDR04DRAFT_1122065 [Suillus decipiens]|nr:hypothetical protein BDR04DRAFT_1122065 [Suillus decipiens]